jgi:hypothetical protein
MAATRSYAETEKIDTLTFFTGRSVSVAVEFVKGSVLVGR